MARDATERALPRAPGHPRGQRLWTAWHAARPYTLVALGSMIGGVLRAVASGLLHTQADAGFPWGTLFVNVTGSFLIGFYATLSLPQGRLPNSAGKRQFVMTGICGGYTTFSVFSLETLQLAEAGAFVSAGLNVGLSIAGALAAVWIGHMLASVLNR
jgi:fluoride exporter